MEPMIKSLLDNDLYKYSQGQAVLFQRNMGISYDSVDVEYEFINRGGTKFPDGFAVLLWDQVYQLATLRLTTRERDFFQSSSPYLRRSYFDFMMGYKFDPSQVTITQNGGDLSIKIKGPWYSAIYWEVPLMAIISELYFRVTNQVVDDRLMTSNLQRKIDAIRTRSRFRLSEFGTRRRFSFDVQSAVVKELAKQVPENFVGSSNVFLSMQIGKRPIGTMAHEWIQGHSALFGYPQANYTAMEAWINEFDGALGHALPDTFTTDVFLRAFATKHAKLFDGLRQDSGDPYDFTDKTIARYQELGINQASKDIVYSDNLDIGRGENDAIAIFDYAEKSSIQSGFGIGTKLSNDVGVKPLNMVIKMTLCNGVHVVKLSDVSTKNTGIDPAIHLCKESLGIQQ